MRGRLSIVSFGSFLCVGWRRAEGHGDWKPVRLTPSCRRTSRLREVSLRHELTMPSVKAGNQVASFSVAVPVPSLSAAGCRPTFARATSRPRCAASGGVFLRGRRRGALAHFEVCERCESWRSLAAGMPCRVMSAVRVPSLAAVWLERLTLASAIWFARGAAGASILASAVAPSVASARARLSARSHRPQPNWAVNRTCAKSRAGRLPLRWGFPMASAGRMYMQWEKA